MNYDHTNKVYDYWRNKILPHLTHRFTCSSFDDYLKKISFLPCGKWLKEFDTVNVGRVVFAMDPEQVVKKYAKYCVAHNFPLKLDDGIQRIIYQLSPTLHMEVAIWIWIEHDELQSYSASFICYNNPVEYLNTMDDLWKMRREGNTEDKTKKTGFADFTNRFPLPADFSHELTDKQKSV